MNILKLIVFAIIMLAFGGLAYGQSGAIVGGKNPLDTNKLPARITVLDSILRLKRYATSDTTKVLGIDASGNITLRTKGAGTDTASLSNRINQKISWSDTVSTIATQYDLSQIETTVYPAYSASKAYTSGNIVQGSDGNLYRAIASTTGNSPITNSGAHWELYQANADLTLNVPSRFATISTAWAFLTNARIKNGYYVTIQLADGTYNVGTTTFLLNHAYGSQIQIMGNRASESSVIIRSAYATAGSTPGQQIGIFHVTKGNRFGLIDGVTIKGPGNSITEFAAIAARDGSSISLGTRVTIDSAYFSLFAYNSYIRADSVLCRYGGDATVFAYGSGGYIDFVGGVSTGAYGYFAMAGGLAEFGATLFAIGATFSNNAGHGLYISQNGSVNCNGCTISGNGGYGIKNDGGSVDQTGVSFSSNALGDRKGTGPAQWYSSTSNLNTNQLVVADIYTTSSSKIHAMTNSGDCIISAGSTSGGRGVFRAYGGTGSTDPAIEFYNSGNAFAAGIYYPHSNSSLNFYESGADRLVIKSGSIGIGATSPAASAKVEISSTTQGFLPPRMTATQASAISSPAEGLMVYVTNTNGTFTAKGWWGYNGSAWEKLNN